MRGLQTSKLILSHCTGARLKELSGLSQLSEINLKGCYKLADDGLAALAFLRSLCALNLQECWQITGSGLHHLSGINLFTKALPVFLGSAEVHPCAQKSRCT